MSLEGANRRQYPRVSLNLLIQYRFDTLEEFLCEYAANISEGGIFIATEQPRDQGSMVYLQFALKDGTKLIEGLGKVAHVTPASADPAGMGIEFVNFDEDSRDLIAAIVSDRAAGAASPA